MTIESERELARLREMTAEEKLAVAESLWREAWRLKRASLASRHPEWTSDELDAATRSALGGAGR
jgi:hypothetical protein